VRLATAWTESRNDAPRDWRMAAAGTMLLTLAALGGLGA
jgi:hypothetical protein